MSKLIIVYKSKTGFTQRYAEMAARELGCDLAPWGGADLSGYDTVAFGSRAHAGRVDGLKGVLQACRKYGTGHLVLFATGAMPNEAKEAVEQFWAQNLTAEQLASIPHFYMQGGLCYEKMGFLDRTLMRMAARVMARQADDSPEGQALRKMIGHSYDISSREFVLPMVEHLRGRLC